MGNSPAIAAQYVFEQLHRGRDSEHVHPCTQACTKHGSMNPTHMNLHRWTHIHSSFIDLGIKFMPRFLDVRRSSATDTAAPVSTPLSDVWPKPALWRIVLKRLYDQNLSTPEESEFLCGKKDCEGVHNVCICVCVCSAEGPLWVLNLYRWWTHLGTGSHTKTLTEGEAKWVSLWMSGGVCAYVCVLVCVQVRTTGTRPKPYLTFWLSMPPREPLGLGLQTQNKEKNGDGEINLSAFTSC